MIPISRLRKKYQPGRLTEKDLSSSPFRQFKNWFRNAVKAKLVAPNAMILATASPDGKPSARMVLLKGFDRRGFVFYTNYKSRKGRELSQNPHAALIFYWRELERPVRITGLVKKVSRKESSEYFHSRPRETQLGAWVSRQSSVIENRAQLDRKLNQIRKKYRGKQVPLPPYWGGYRLSPNEFEFWRGVFNRLHDRLCYSKSNRHWNITRLSP